MWEQPVFQQQSKCVWQSVTDEWTRGSKFITQYYDKVVCPNCMHTACHSTYFVTEAAVRTKSKQIKCVIWDAGKALVLIQVPSSVEVSLVWTVGLPLYPWCLSYDSTSVSEHTSTPPHSTHTAITVGGSCLPQCIGMEEISECKWCLVCVGWQLVDWI